ncbi:MAG: GTPase Era [Chromatiales bacterium]|nr:GTPase Era [Chromatiales bacterium]
MSDTEFKAGFVAVVGRPNVGKSTLVNTLLGKKISIVTARPQTTRHRILGILNREHAQLILVDTPGLHRHSGKAINRSMNRAAASSLVEADAVAFVVDALRFTEEDEDVLKRVQQAGLPTILVVNKVDQIKDKSRLLPFMQELASRHEFAAVIPVSALSGKNVEDLEKEMVALLPESPLLFPSDQTTDKSDAFMAAEIIREKLMTRVHQELPYGLTVEVEQYSHDEQGRVLVQAIIWVGRAGHKGIVIGKSGQVLKQIGREARIELKKRVKKPVHLDLWVKVLENWSDSERALQRFGYETA